MKSISQVLGLTATILGIVGAVAAENPEGSPIRYLIVVDTSASMSMDREVATNAIEKLLLGGFNGRVQTGDLVSVWTFGEKLNNSVLAPTMWTTESRPQIAGRTLRALRDVKFAKTPNMAEAINAIKKSAMRSGSLDVFLVTDGAVPVQGTPFDREIDRVFQQHGAAMRKVKKPFIVALSAHNGELAAHAISPGGNRVFIPPAQKPLAISATDDDVFGIARSAGTNAIAQSGTNGALADSVAVRTNPPKTLSVSEISEILNRQQQQKSDALAAAAAAAKSAANSNAPASALPTNSIAHVKTNPLAAESVATPQRVPIEVESNTPASKPADTPPNAAVEPKPTEKTQASDDAGKDKTSPAVDAMDKGPASVQETATIIPPSIRAIGRRYLMTAAGFFAVAILLGWMLVRRRRSRVYPSLITRSLRERERL